MKKILCLILAFIMGLSLFACGSGGDTTTPDDGEAAVKDTLVVAVSTSPDTFDPTYEMVLYNNCTLRMVYDQLIRLDENNEYVPWLAESYEAISDTEWKFVLRDVKFSDGSPVTSADCVASIQAVRDSAQMSGQAAWLDSFEIIDDKTFIIKTTAPSSSLVADMATYHYIVPAYTLEEGYDLANNPVGTGPYTLVEWQRGDHLTLEAKEDYWNADYAPKIKTIEWRIVPEGISRTIGLQNGEYDFVYDVQASDLPTLEADENVTVYNGDYCSPFYMAFNLQNEYLADLNVRKAIACAINRENASKVATNSYSRVITSSFVPGVLGSTDAYACKTDMEAAKQYMEAAGVGEITLTVITKEEVMKKALESIQSDLKEIGITMNIEMMDTATYFAEAAEGNFDLIVGKQGTPDLVNYAVNSFATGATFNFNFLSDPELDALIQSAQTCVDPDERAAILDDIIEICDGNVYRTGIYLLTNTRAYSADLDGFTTNIDGHDWYNTLYWK